MSGADLEGLRQEALKLGAAAAVVVSPSELKIEARFAEMCRTPGCPSYGLAPGCPPHAPKPEVFKAGLAAYQAVLVFRLDVEAAGLQGEGRLEETRKSHQLAAQLERRAAVLGFSRLKAVAAGSCKELFCPQDPVCVVLEQGVDCRFPGQARASLSALGVDVRALFARLGWELTWKVPADQGEPVAMAALVGMVFVG
ncbi:DUF2284 domain-containing protein [Desulfogranum mediterraneum]|uniref:DUF2284 domain-containing protein n=1 Tax=Desulfogranum mediterraneum TaxID=160661 RepID=UPI0012946432|nr:DUF2284 domain-containing protein [Desulfogranum mediterraneum]